MANAGQTLAQKEAPHAFRRILAEGRVKQGYAADHGAAFHFVDGHLERIVSSRPLARGYRLSLEDGQPREEELETVYLGA